MAEAGRHADVHLHHMSAPSRNCAQMARRNLLRTVHCAAVSAPFKSAGTREALEGDIATAATHRKHSQAPTDEEYDAVIIGAGMGGLTTASQMASKGAKVLVLEK